MILESYESNCEHKLIDGNTPRENINNRVLHDVNKQYTLPTKDASLLLPTMSLEYSLIHHGKSLKHLNRNTEKPLSSQVNKHHPEDSQNSNLNRCYSYPSSNIEEYEYEWEEQKNSSSKFWKNQEILDVHEDITTCIDTQHKKQHSIRPPLVGWPSQLNIKKNVTSSEQIVPNAELPLKSCNETNSQCECKDDKNDSSKILEPVCLMTESGDRDIKIVSPTSSIASQNKPLEWDSLADVGYHNTLTPTRGNRHGIFHLTDSELPIRNSNTKLSRLDPEGTTTTTLDASIKNTKLNDSLFTFPNHSLKPNAHSTRLFDDGLDLKKNMKSIIPINFNTAVTVENDNIKNSSKTCFVSNKSNRSYNKLDTKKKKHKSIPISILLDENQSTISSEALKIPLSTLKRNASMHELVIPKTSISLKKSKSELNLKESTNYSCKSSLTPFNFLSSSSITTIINKPSMCDKNTQTNLNGVNKKIQQSKAIQASSTMDASQMKIKSFTKSPNEKLHEKKRVENSVRKPAILEKAKNFLFFSDKDSNFKNLENKVKAAESNESSPSESHIAVDGGRTSNSFEYFSGHAYRNSSYEKGIGHRSVLSERSHSTIPNTSSSFDEKLWGNSNSLLRDLERSLNILKSLINTNKYDKKVKKRLIHHVIKRLVTARYTDDKIEHDLEENVPWNPDDARNKIYCTEIIQALATKQNHDSTEEFLENWKPNRQNFSYDKTTTKHNKNFTEMMNFASSEDSDAFDERTTDKTDGMQDGRKARLGLRSNDKYNHSRHHYKHQIKNRTVIDTDKSGSSECFLPQSRNIKLKGKNLNKALCSKMMRKDLLSPKPLEKTNTFPTPNVITVSSPANNVCNSNTITTATSTSTTVTIITSVDTTSFTPTSTMSQSSNNENKIQSVIGYNDIDWRLPATISERRFKYEKKTTLGKMSQLIDYVEIEKQNQLLWINNEINHLLNLKKLLEEPTVVEKHEIKKKKHRNAVSKNKTLEDEWSSHENLATVSNKRNKSSKTTTNDYTQTIVHDIQFFDDKNCKIVDEFNTNSQISQSDLQQNLFVEILNQKKRKERKSSHQSHVLYSPFQDTGTQTIENNLLNKDVNDQTPVITQFPINSKKDTKNILNDKYKSESSATIDEDQEIFHTSQNHCYGCLCDQMKIKTSKFDGNQNNRTILSIPKMFYKCNIQDENVTDKRKLKRAENNQIEGKKKSEHKLQTCQNSGRCQKCGIIFTDTNNEKCQCTYLCKKPIAYELYFESKNDNKYNYESAQLKDYLKQNKSNFVNNIEMRKQYMMEISQLRQIKKEKIMQLLTLASPSNPTIKSKTSTRSGKICTKISKDQMKTRFRSRYLQSNERRNKRKQQEKSDQLRHNYLMAKIFCKKLQQKVLQGQVTLSQSMSVVSNL